jgi:ubiquinone biosynthesis protein
VSEPVLRWRAERRGKGRAVEAVLARHGLLRRPYAVATGTAFGDGFAARLGAALLELGPGFAAFGRYLGSRPDLLDAASALELLALPDRGAAAPPEIVRALLAVELGRPPEQVFAHWDEAPREVRFLVQTHGARLAGGEAVLVRFARPGVLVEVERALPELPRLGAAFAAAEQADFPLPAAIDDFRAAVDRALDFAAEADDLAALARETAAGSPLVVPRPHRALSTSALLVVDDLAVQAVTAGEEAEGGGDEARRLCLAWLHQALRGTVFPVEPEGGRLLRLPQRKLAFAGGPFARLAVTAQNDLWAYLLAAADHDPDAAGSHLLREMVRLEGADEEQLRLRMRQAVPFRDGAWSAAGDTLAEQLFVDWRFARESGFRPRPALVPFFRGLFAVAAAARALAPGRDALREAVEELRLITTVDRVQQGLEPDNLVPNLERYAALMLQLPQKLDDVLTRAAEGGAVERRPAERPQPQRMPGVALALLLAVGAVLILAGYPQRAGDGIAPFLAVVALGSIGLWLATRRAGTD